MSNYRRGRALEYAVIARFRDHQDTAHVMRSAGSKGAADIIALAGNRTRHPLVCLIQCKTYGIPSEEERSTLGRIAKESGAIPVCAWREKGEIRFTPLHTTGRPVYKRGVDLDLLLLYMCWGKE